MKEVQLLYDYEVELISALKTKKSCWEDAVFRGLTVRKLLAQAGLVAFTITPA